jgi:hypothetical protein
MPFGKYKGKPMKEVPADYLDWLHGQDFIHKYPAVLEYIKKNRTVIDSELPDEE